MQDLKGVILPVEGLEALRLADARGLDQETAARQMGISRPTFSRVLSDARRQVARALSSGWAIRIEGGDYEVTSPGSSQKRGRQGRERCGGGFRCAEQAGFSLPEDPSEQDF